MQRSLQLKIVLISPNPKSTDIKQKSGEVEKLSQKMFDLVNIDKDDILAVIIGIYRKEGMKEITGEVTESEIPSPSTATCN